MLIEASRQYGEIFVATADALEPLPPPTFDGGTEFASNVVLTFGEFGQRFIDSSDKLAAADPTDAAAFAEAAAAFGTDLQEAFKPLDDLSNLAFTAETEAAIGAIPSCAALNL